MRNRHIHSLFKRGFSAKTDHNLNKKDKWNSVVGLEIHAQILSNSKLFSGSASIFGRPPNYCVSFFDCATPGTLPVLNSRCVEAGVLTSLALSCKVNEISMFDRKHYFYADMPAGYQITQQRQPIAVDGKCEFYVFNTNVHKKPYLTSCRIKQIQLEQDSGKSIHEERAKRSLIDLNRAGVPLMELVFEPDLKDGEEAAALVKELTFILETLNTCSGKMEEGALRVDANISVNRPGEPLGTRTEVKNITSFRAVAKAIDFEIERQIAVLEEGGEIINETRSWSWETSETVSMRDKEAKQDYRFIPESNLPPLRIHVDSKVENNYGLVSAVSLKPQLPELPSDIRKKMLDQFQISLITTLQIMNVPELFKYFNAIMNLNIKSTPKQVANFLVISLMEVLKEESLEINKCPINENQLAEIIDMVTLHEINIHVAKTVILELLANPSLNPRQVVEEKDLYQITNEEELTKICKEVIEDNPKIVKQFKKGQYKRLALLLGEVSKRTNQKAHMAMVSKIMRELLK